MTTLTLDLVAEIARIETEERIQRAQRRREVAGSGESESGIRRRIAGMLFARAPSSGASETLPSSTFASTRATTS